MKIGITIEINETDPVFSDLRDFTKISIDIAFNKYGFDILKDNQEKRLEYIATEISLQSDKVLIGNASYNLSEILYLIDELKKYNLSLSTVYIPSEQRVEKRKQQAIEEQKRWGYREGISDEEIETNFQNFRKTLLEIKNGLKDTLIKVKEV